MISELSKSSLCEFLILAKNNSSYACQGERAASKCILSKNYLYTNENYRYEDQYFGELLDIGEEIVWYQEIPIWGMGYRGGMLEPYRAIGGETFEVLRKALLKLPKDFPVRGPADFKDGSFHYINEYKGDILSFTGNEYILKDDTKIYERNYLGGLIYGKHNPEMRIID